jgi:uncharacterized membrane protein (UPF0127 family)
MNWRLFASLLGAVLLAGACRKQAPPAIPLAVPPANPMATAQTNAGSPLPTHALPKLRTMKLWLGAEVMTAELAASSNEVSVGMMYRTNIDKDSGMLLLMGRPAQWAFWTKNCPLALSAAYIDPSGTILELHDFQPQNTNPVPAATLYVQYFLETSQGWFAQHNITTGMLVRTEYGTFPETFTPTAVLSGKFGRPKP